MGGGEDFLWIYNLSFSTLYELLIGCMKNIVNFLIMETLGDPAFVLCRTTWLSITYFVERFVLFWSVPLSEVLLSY